MIMHFICHSPSNKTGSFVRLLFSVISAPLLSNCTSHVLLQSKFAQQQTGRGWCPCTEHIWYFDTGWKPRVRNSRGDGVQGVNNFMRRFSANSKYKMQLTSLSVSGRSDNKIWSNRSLAGKWKVGSSSPLTSLVHGMNLGETRQLANCE